MRLTSLPPTLATPLIIEDGEVDKSTSIADDNEGHKDTAAATNETMAPPKATTKTPAAAAATTKKKTASPNTTGETNADYSTTTPAVRVISEIYDLSTQDKYAISYFAEGSTDFADIKFFVNGMLPKVGGYLATLSNDGFAINWSRPIEEHLFTMGHLKSIMGEDYSPSHVRVRSFDEVTQTMYKNKIKSNTNEVYWGDPQKVHLKSKSTGTPITQAKVYQAPPIVDVSTDRKGRQNYQFHTIVSCKIQLADLRKTATIKAKTKVVDMYDIPSSQGTTPSPGPRRSRKRQCDWGAAIESSSSPRGVG